MRQRWAIGVLDLGTPLPGPGFRRPSGKEDTVGASPGVTARGCPLSVGL